MNQWLQFLTQQGALFDSAADTGLDAAAMPDVLGFGGTANATATTAATDFVAPLNRLGLIAASGEEAARFLHSQLTNDVEHLTSAEARLAGYCSVKGRLTATFLIWKTDDTILLQLPSEILPLLQKRLQMYVLRAKVKLNDVSAGHVILGLTGAKAAAALRNWFEPMPPAPYSTAHCAAGTLIRVADAGQQPRYQWITTAQGAQEAWLTLGRDLIPAGAAAWRLTEIEAGVPQITHATQEQFVPQMINYEVLGGVNFKKGCYPGQEIVARSQYLGKLKRRMQRASVAGVEAQAGMAVFSSADPAQPCGMVVNAERSSAQQMECLVELKTAALDGASSIHLGAADGPLLVFGKLPYALPPPA